MSFASWERITIPLADLRLDASNPRFGDGRVSNGDTEEANLESLLSVGDLRPLLLSMARDGFMPTEVLVTAVERGFHVVVEGNRRLACLKLLSGQLTAHDLEIPTISSTLPNELLVVQAPSREEATPYILRRHTESSVKKWSRLSQARFVWLRRGERSLKQLSNETGISKLTLRKLLRLGQADANLQNGLPSDMNFGVLERVLDNSAARNRLAFTENDALSDDAIEDLGRIVDALRDGPAQTTRTLNLTEDILAWLDRVIVVDPSDDGAQSSPGTGTHWSSETDAPGAIADESPSEPEGSEQSGLTFPPIPTGRRPAISEEALESTAALAHLSRFATLAEETRRLLPSTTPETCLIILRTLLQLAATEEQEARGEEPSLDISRVVKTSIQAAQSNSALTRSQRNAIDALSEGPEGYLKPLHQFVHSTISQASSQQYWNHYRAWSPLLEFCWSTIKTHHAE